MLTTPRCQLVSFFHPLTAPVPRTPLPSRRETVLQWLSWYVKTRIREAPKKSRHSNDGKLDITQRLSYNVAQ